MDSNLEAIASVVAAQVDQGRGETLDVSKLSSNHLSGNNLVPVEDVKLKRALPTLNRSKKTPRSRVTVERISSRRPDDPALPRPHHKQTSPADTLLLEQRQQQTQTHGVDQHGVVEVGNLAPLPSAAPQQQDGLVQDAVLVGEETGDDNGATKPNPALVPPPRQQQQQPSAVEPSQGETQPRQHQRRRKSNIKAAAEAEADFSWISLIPDAPTFHPTPEQWKTPLKYIASIKNAAISSGICVIRPFPDPTDNHDIDSLIANKDNKNIKLTSHQQPMNNKWIAWESGDFFQNPKTYNLQSFKKLAEDNLRTRFDNKAGSLKGLACGGSGGGINTTDGDGFSFEEAYWRQKGMSEKLWVDYASDVEGSLFPLLPNTAKNNSNNSGSKDGDGVEGTCAHTTTHNITTNSKNKEVAFTGSRVGEKKRKRKAPPPTMPRCPPLHPGGQWDLRHLPTMEGSSLRWCPYSLPGITAPMLYIGQAFSTFSWHVEDHSLLSINYAHAGENKLWYGVPGAAADAFEQLARKQVFLDLCEDEGLGSEEKEQLRVSEALMRKTAMFSPKLMLDAGIPVCRAVQQPGDFVVTFPRAFHAGFSTGFNMGEAVNFAINEDWWQEGEEMRKKYRLMGKDDMIPFEQLLCMEGKAALEKLIERANAVNMQVTRRDVNNNSSRKKRRKIEGGGSGSARGDEEEEDVGEMIDGCLDSGESEDLSQMLELFGAKVEDTTNMLKMLKSKGAIEMHVEEPCVEDNGGSSSSSDAIEKYMSLLCPKCGEQAFLCTSVVEPRQQNKKVIAVEEVVVVEEEEEEEKLPPHCCLHCTHQAFENESHPELYAIKLHIKTKIWGEMKFLWKQAKECRVVY